MAGRAGRLLMLVLGLAGCTPVVIPAGLAFVPPEVAREAFVMADGARLPYRAWLPPGPPRAIILGLHGFGDYSLNAFSISAPLLTAEGIALYAYDQRGFGAAPHPGLWAGGATLAADAVAVARLLRDRHPGIPLFMMGESMGAAVLLVAATGASPPPADGYILLAPGIRGRETMSRFSQGALEFASRVIPAVGFSGSAPGFVPTDNPEAMRRWSNDPLTLKTFRVDIVHGLIGLMDAALAAAPAFQARALILYGGQDRIMPPAPVRRLLRGLPGGAGQRLAYYPEGHHLLLRDLDRATVTRDIAAWLGDPEAPLPAAEAGRIWLAGPEP